jgi:nucleotide-binding universal stress UspA family protein
MKQFKNILLISPLDKQLIAQATSILTTSQAKLTLMSVAPLLDDAIVQTSDGKTVDLQKLLLEELKSELEEEAGKIKGDDFRVSTAAASGQPFIEIIRQVISNDHDLVMMRADGVSSLRDQLFGTVSSHLMRKCPCPVWILKPSRRRKLRHVFAAVDPDPSDPERNMLNVEILKRAQILANNDNAKLHIIHAWNTLGGNLNRGKRWMTKSEIRMHAEQVATDHRNRLNSLLDIATDGNAIVHMIQGQAGEVIPEIVDREKADLLVMGTVCRTGIPGFFIGNTAEMTLSQVDCSVLTIKPRQFKSPVQLVE